MHGSAKVGSAASPALRAGRGAGYGAHCTVRSGSARFRGRTKHSRQILPSRRRGAVGSWDGFLAVQSCVTRQGLLRRVQRCVGALLRGCLPRFSRLHYCWRGSSRGELRARTVQPSLSSATHAHIVCVPSRRAECLRLGGGVCALPAWRRNWATRLSRAPALFGGASVSCWRAACIAYLSMQRPFHLCTQPAPRYLRGTPRRAWDRSTALAAWELAHGHGWTGDPPFPASLQN